MFKRHSFFVMVNLFFVVCFLMIAYAENEDTKDTLFLNQRNNDDNQQVNCSIQLVEESINHELILKIQEGIKLIYMQLNFESGNEIENRGMYKPLQWMQVQDDTGMEILKYDERRQILSMTMLKNVFYSMEVSLIERPSRCLSSLSNEMYERKIRNFLLSGMVDTKGHLDHKNIQDGVNICHLKLIKDTIPQFHFNCCQVTPRGHIICKKQTPSKNSQLFSFLLYFLIAFSPLLLVSKMGASALQLDVHSYTEDVDNRSFNRGNVVSIPRKSLICFDEGPINFHYLLHDRLIMCRCKDPDYQKCCEKKICGNEDWKNCLKKVTKLWKLHLLLIVLVLRSTLYLAFEYGEEKDRDDFIEKEGHYSFFKKQGNIKYFACLWIFFPLIFIFSKIFKEVTENIQTFLHASVLDLKEIPFDRILPWSIYILFLLVPTHGTVKSLIAFPFFLMIGIPFCVVLIFLCIVPLNRMMMFYVLNTCPLKYMNRRCSSFLDKLKVDEIYGNFKHTKFQIYSRKRKGTRLSKCLHVMVNSIYLTILFYSYIFLTMVCIRFVMMLVIYNIIGAIEDWDRYLVYLVFGSWIIIYSHRSWNTYTKVYRIYNREIQYLLLNLISERLPSIPSSTHVEDRLLILSIPDSKNKKTPILINNEKIDVPQMTVFLDKKNKSYILRDTFEDFRSSDAFGDKKVEPKAFSHLRFFIFVSLFILVVFLITQKFLKGSNQIVVLIVTGVIPWLYERYTSDQHVRILDSVEQLKVKYKDELDCLISQNHDLPCLFPDIENRQQHNCVIEDNYNDDDAYDDGDTDTDTDTEYYRSIADSKCCSRGNGEESP